MIFVFVILFLLLIFVCLLLLFLLKNKKNNVVSNEKSSLPNYTSPKPKEEQIENLGFFEKSDVIEILDFNDNLKKDEKLEKDILDETIDLNELFKTMSINIIKQDDIVDFGLLRKKKKKL